MAALAVCPSVHSLRHYAGGDISLLPVYEKAGAIYRDQDGNPVGELLPYLRKEGMNAMRVRLFVDPVQHAQLHPGSHDPNARQSLEYIIPLCQRIVEAGFDLMLDFHYSDTWADPGKQWTPEAWKNLTDEELYEKIYDYTRTTLLTLREEGIVPAFIQPGNEISYGMLWGPEGTPEPAQKRAYMGSNANWDRLGHLLRQAVKACREVCPDARIVLHTERVAQPDVQNNFYDWMKKLEVDYDIIGLSYYPYYQGGLEGLGRSLGTLEERYPDKQIMIVETGYSYAWGMGGDETQCIWPYSDEGQNAFARDLVATLEKHPHVDGLFWWWMEYNAYGTSLTGWYNAPLFDSRTGKATKALKTICSFADDSGVGRPSAEPDNDSEWYDLRGVRVENIEAPGLYVGRGRKILVR